MDLTITFCRQTVKTLNLHLHATFRGGNLLQIKRISALLMLAEQQPAEAVADRLGVGRSRVYAWLHAFVLDRFASLQVRKPSGRPAKLTPVRQQRLVALIAADPEAGGYRTSCWHSALIQALILREFGVLYTVHYLGELLHNLGHSYQ